MPTKKELKRRLERKEMLLQGAQAQCERLRQWWLDAEQRRLKPPNPGRRHSIADLIDFLGLKIWKDPEGELWDTKIDNVGYNYCDIGSFGKDRQEAIENVFDVLATEVFLEIRETERRETERRDAELNRLRAEKTTNPEPEQDPLTQVAHLLGVQAVRRSPGDWEALFSNTKGSYASVAASEAAALGEAFARFAYWALRPEDNFIREKVIEILGFALEYDKDEDHWYATFTKYSDPCADIWIPTVCRPTALEAMSSAFRRLGRAIVQKRTFAEHTEVRKRADKLIQKYSKEGTP